MTCRVVDPYKYVPMKPRPTSRLDKSPGGCRPRSPPHPPSPPPLSVTALQRPSIPSYPSKNRDAPCVPLLACSPFASWPSSFGSFSTQITVQPPFTPWTSASVTLWRTRSQYKCLETDASFTAARIDENVHTCRSLSGGIILRVSPFSQLYNNRFHGWRSTLPRSPLSAVISACAHLLKF